MVFTLYLVVSLAEKERFELSLGGDVWSFLVLFGAIL